jgi:hypothetical protein
MTTEKPVEKIDINEWWQTRLDDGQPTKEIWWAPWDGMDPDPDERDWWLTSVEDRAKLFRGKKTWPNKKFWPKLEKQLLYLRNLDYCPICKKEKVDKAKGHITCLETPCLRAFLLRDDGL